MFDGFSLVRSRWPYRGVAFLGSRKSDLGDGLIKTIKPLNGKRHSSWPVMQIQAAVTLFVPSTLENGLESCGTDTHEPACGTPAEPSQDSGNGMMMALPKSKPQM